jgi:hypothetical protein
MRRSGASGRTPRTAEVIMAKWMRLAAVGAALLVSGMTVTAAGFTVFDAAHSDAALAALAAVLFAGTFALLRWGLRWSVRPSETVSVDAEPRGSHPVTREATPAGV